MTEQDGTPSGDGHEQADTDALAGQSAQSVGDEGPRTGSQRDRLEDKRSRANPGPFEAVADREEDAGDGRRQESGVLPPHAADLVLGTVAQVWAATGVTVIHREAGAHPGRDLVGADCRA